MVVTGRPTDYDPDRHIPWIKSMARIGMNNEQMASDMGISVATLYNWQRDHPEFLEAIKEGKSESDFKVVSSLFRRAMGYKYTDREVRKEKGGKNGDITKTFVLEREMPPDVSAIKMWLCNRDPTRWADKYLSLIHI